MEQSCSMHSNQQWVPRNIFYELDTTLPQSTLSFVFTKNYITLLTTKTLKLSSKITFTSILLSFFLLPSILCHPHIWCYRFSPSGSRNLIQIMAWAELTPEPSVFLWGLHHHLGNRDSLMMNTLQRGGQPTTNPWNVLIIDEFAKSLLTFWRDTSLFTLFTSTVYRGSYLSLSISFLQLL